MSRTSATRDAWHPQTRLDRDAILHELQDVVASPHFCNSKRYPALLQYIVEKTLSGEADVLKERTLGVEVFDRSPAYDTNADTVVRYTAGEVRKRLSLYYHELDTKPAIQISLPAGSYVPEFFHTQEVEGELFPEAVLPSAPTLTPAASVGLAESEGPLDVVPRKFLLHHRMWFLYAVLAVVFAGVASWIWRTQHLSPESSVTSFWAPVLHDQPTILMCTGGSVFAQNNFSGVSTAGKDIDYPFISLQSASAIAKLSGLIQQSGGTTQLRAAATTPLTELRDHPVILLGGYNNPWTLRLLQPLRFHFSPESVSSAIVDVTQPKVLWERDQSLPYSSADDFALIARVHDPVTDNWVVALAGIGRNGTEAAAQFVTSSHYLDLVKKQIDGNLSGKNIEIVLRVNVIEGKTGAPTILAVHVW
jgi:hypothetical protein